MGKEKGEDVASSFILFYFLIQETDNTIWKVKGHQ